jgi:aspartyl-tRNA synthetase
MLTQTVQLGGWVSRIRALSSGLFFIVLRDWSGTVQLTMSATHCDAQVQSQMWTLIENGTLGKEAVVAVTGVVQARPIGQSNPTMPSGSLEIFVTELRVLNASPRELPFASDDHSSVLPAEETRLRFRPLDLRRPCVQEALRLRAKVARSFRQTLESLGFLEVETPILFKSTPEGAREFLVASAESSSTGPVYALPQSPQQFKQLLMVGGVDRYYQFARCFRDEGLRSDRQPEFTQLDLEMSFVEEEQPVMQVLEKAIRQLWTEVKGPQTLEETPFPQITYDEAMQLYGSDKPNTSFPFKFVCSIATEEHIRIEGLLLKGRGRASRNDSGSHEWCVPLEGGQTRSIRSVFRDAGKAVRGTMWTWSGNDLAQCETASAEVKEAIQAVLDRRGLNVGARDCLLLAARRTDANVGATALGKARLEAIRAVVEGTGLVPENKWNFMWVHQFPLLKPTDAEGTAAASGRSYESMHHPFTAPIPEDAPLLFSSPKHPLSLRAQHYDLVLNGTEIAGGSLRIHNADLQERVMRELLGMNDAAIGQFSHLLRGLRLGAPPHGGLALGLDRLVALLGEHESIRSVIAFPKTSTGQDLCMT